jgi:hypothetical protein
MRTSYHNAFTVFDWYDVMDTGEETDAGVGSGRRRRFLVWYGFSFSTTLANVFVIEMHDSVVFSAVRTIL